MSKVEHAGKWYTRFDLTLTKIQKVLSLLSAASLVTAAIVLGGSVVLIVTLSIGAILLLVLAYGLDKSGFQSTALEETFFQQNKPLWVKQSQLSPALIALFMRMSEDELMTYIRYWADSLHATEQIGDGIETIIQRLREQGKEIVILEKVLECLR